MFCCRLTLGHLSVPTLKLLRSNNFKSIDLGSPSRAVWFMAFPDRIHDDVSAYSRYAPKPGSLGNGSGPCLYLNVS